MSVPLVGINSSWTLCVQRDLALFASYRRLNSFGN